LILKLLEQKYISITNIDAEGYGSDHRNLYGISDSDDIILLKGIFQMKN